MTDYGDSSKYGVVISSALNAGAPSGNKLYLFVDDVKRVLKTKDKITHMANWTSYHIPMLQHWYEVTLNECVIAAKTMASVNQHHSYLNAWVDTTPVYLWVIDNVGSPTYMDFIIADTTYDYLLGLIRDPTDNLSHKKFKFSLKFEQCAV